MCFMSLAQTSVSPTKLMRCCKKTEGPDHELCPGTEPGNGPEDVGSVATVDGVPHMPQGPWGLWSEPLPSEKPLSL